MRTPTIRIVDFSGGTDFHRSLEATRNLIMATAALYEAKSGVYAPAEPLAHVEVASSADPAILTAALHAETLVLHLASHMRGRGEGEPAFYGRENEISVLDVAGWLTHRGRGIYADCVYVDGCNGGTRKFISAMRDCLEAPATYIASRRAVTESECTLFAASFYGALLQRKGKGQDPLDRTAAAAERAQSAYEAATGAVCPFRVETVQPSAKARAAFGAT